MKLLFIFISLLFGVVLAAERPVWQAGKKQILLWPKGAPGEVAGADEEVVETICCGRRVARGADGGYSPVSPSELELGDGTRMI